MLTSPARVHPAREAALTVQAIWFTGVMAGTALVSAVATPLFAWLGTRWGVVSAPREDRWHKRPTPLLGGAAIALAALTGVALAAPASLTSLVIGACALGAFALGLLDDFRHVAPSTKLAGQVMVAVLLAFGGVRVELIGFTPLAFLVTVFWVVAIMNAVNLLDNMDGLAAGITVIAAGVLGVTAFPWNPFAATLSFATAGAALGFLSQNFFPARVFMGDAGSQLLGFLLAAVALTHRGGAAANAGLAVFGPVLVLALPIFDTAMVATLRRMSGRPISRGGRDHTSHRLAALGLTDRSAVLTLYGIGLALAIVGVIGGSISALLPPLFVLVTVGLILFGIFLSEIEVDSGWSSEQAAREKEPTARAFAIYGRFGAEISMDVVLLTTAYYLAYMVRFEGDQPAAWLHLFTESVPIVVGAEIAALVALGVYRTLWRYLTIQDVVAVGRAIIAGAAVGVFGIVLAFRFEAYSRAVLLLDPIIAFLIVTGSRAFLVWLRQWAASWPHADDRRVLIVGANDRGAVALRFLGHASGVRHRAVGFIDDDPGKRYRRIAGIPIVGTSRELPSVVQRLRPDLVLFATAGDGASLRAACEELGVPWRELSVEA